MIPLIEMEVMTEDGLRTKLIDSEEAKEQHELPHIWFHKHDEKGWKFDTELYLDKLMNTRYAEALLTLHTGLNGTYHTNEYGYVGANEQEGQWLYELLKEQVL